MFLFDIVGIGYKCQQLFESFSYKSSAVLYRSFVVSFTCSTFEVFNSSLKSHGLLSDESKYTSLTSWRENLFLAILVCIPRISALSVLSLKFLCLVP